jgi:hypothetical protein
MADAWFSIDYRIAPDFRLPQAREDVDTAIRWTKAHATEYYVAPPVLHLSAIRRRLPGKFRGHALHC